MKNTLSSLLLSAATAALFGAGCDAAAPEPPLDPSQGDIVGAPGSSLGSAGAPHSGLSASFNAPGNILFTDQFNNRVVEMDPAGNIVWTFGHGPGDTTANALAGTNDAERVGNMTLMAGTGVPAGATKNCKDGCVDNRVLLVDPDGRIIWQYGQFGVTGSGPDQLDTPVANWYLPSGNILITDQGNQRVIEVRQLDKAIVWQYGQNGVAGARGGQLDSPNSAELLANGNILIADENNDRAIEVTHTAPSRIVAMFSAGGTASGVAFASRLSNGNTLLTDANNARIVEVDEGDDVVFEYVTSARPGSNTSPLPTRAVRLANGNTLISDQFNDQVLEIDPSKKIVAAYGTIDDPGYNPHSALYRMNAPYSAYVIGDYTGLTAP